MVKRDSALHLGIPDRALCFLLRQGLPKHEWPWDCLGHSHVANYERRWKCVGDACI